jgi:uncharacterized protein YegP (UPF0339 family)
MPKFQAFEDKAGNWRWHLIGDNNRTVATSGEAFASRSNALRAAAVVKRLASTATLPAAIRVPRRRPSGGSGRYLR